MEQSIFGYYWREAVERDYPGDAHFLKEVQYHKLFAETEYRFLFRSEDQRNVFDARIQRIRSDGTYSTLVEDYANLFERYQPKSTGSTFVESSP